MSNAQPGFSSNSIALAYWDVPTSTWIPIYGTSNALNVSVVNPFLPSNYALETGGNLATVATNSANLDVALSTRLKPADTLAGVTTVGAVTSITNPVSVTGSVTVNTITGFALETGGNLATVNTNTAPFVVAGAGGYVRQDSTATIAKETGGNLTTIASAIKSEDSISVDQDKGIAALGVRKDSSAVVNVNANGDYSFIALDTFGRTWSRDDLLEAQMVRSNAISGQVLKIQQAKFAGYGGAGFVPLEIPSFYTGA